MNFDDPKLTAYALGELDSAEDRAAVEALLRENPEAAAEVDEVRAVAQYLRRELHEEETSPLTPGQREQVLAAAAAPVTVNGYSQESAPTGGASGTPTNVITGPWWRRHWVPSAIAATVVLSTSITLLWSVQRYRGIYAVAGSSGISDPRPLDLNAADKLMLQVGDRITGQKLGKELAETRASGEGILSADRDSSVALDAPAANSAPAAPQAQPAPAEKLKLGKELAEADSGLLPYWRSRGIEGTGKSFLDREAAPADVSGLPNQASSSDPQNAPGSRVDSSAAGLPALTSATETKSRAAQAPAPRERQISDAAKKSLSMGNTTATPAQPPGIVATGAVRGGSLEKDTDALRLAPAKPAAASALQPTPLSPIFEGETIRRKVAQVSATKNEPQLVQQQAPAPYFRGRAIEELQEKSSLASVDESQFGDRLLKLDDSTVRLQREPSNTESYDTVTDNEFLAVRDNPLSTFSIDVDTASYANVRRFLMNNQRPPKGAVRIEELVNYFPYSYPQPQNDDPFSCTMEVAACPWAPEHRLVRVGLKGREIAKEKLPPSNLVFLLDVSGSMQPANRLPLVKECMQQLVSELREQDSVGIVVYAGASGVVLEPTSDKEAIRSALDRLEAGGSTNGAAGIRAAYDLAQRAFKKEGSNRVILATDGDFNVGVTNQSELVDLIQKRAKSGVFLSVLGFGMGNTKDSTMEKLADKGNGNYAYIDSLKEGHKVLVEQMTGTLFTIAKDVKIQVEFNPGKVGAYRLIGYENRLLAKEDFNDDTKDAGEIGAGHTVTALYELVPAGQSLPVNSSVDPLKYQPVAPALTLEKYHPVAPSLTPESTPTPSRKPMPYGQPKQGDPFSGSVYLLDDKGKTASTVTPGATPAPQTSVAHANPADSSELLTLKLRFKQPTGDKSVLREFPLTDNGSKWNNSTADFRWSAAVASFGMLLRDSPHRGNATWAGVAELADDARGEDSGGYRAEFLNLVDRARQLVPVTPLNPAPPAPETKPSSQGKVGTLIIPEFELKDASVLDALDALTKKSVEIDTEKTGVPVVYAGPNAGAQAKVTIRTRNLPVFEIAKMIADSASLQVQEVSGTVVLRPAQ